MARRASIVHCAAALAAFAVSAAPATDGADRARSRPAAIHIEPSPVVERLLREAREAGDESRFRRLALFHGRYEAPDQLSAAQRAERALARYDLDAPPLRNPAVSAALRGEAARKRGEPERALELLPAGRSAALDLERARAMLDLGRREKAIEALAPWRARLAEKKPGSAAALVAHGRVLALLARLEGRPARDYHRAMELFARARERDRLYWPAHLAEGELLARKSNAGEARKALGEALALNPKASRAWFVLGRLAAERFRFEHAASCVERLRAIREPHLLADELLVRLRLHQRDPRRARDALERAIARHPSHRRLRALDAAVAAVSFDDAGLERALARYEKLAPGSGRALFAAGAHLAANRQYPRARDLLERAVKRRPRSSRMRAELGLLLMQSGDEAAAARVLERAVELDPFHKRASNQLKLARRLLEYERIETEHFVVKYDAPIDRVLARDIAERVERMRRELAATYAHAPEKRTLIEIMPDARHFAVRITGIPEIWTIAASTGDVVAMTPPREGAHQRGRFDWYRVLRHEYTHTVTLAKTRRRLPHWFTEACAVRQEPGPRSYRRCRLLAGALANDRLFGLDEINWAFIRPKRSGDRALAYAQAAWMHEYIVRAHGQDAIVAMLDRFATGERSGPVIEAVTGEPADAFMRGFREWAEKQVEAWGLARREAAQTIRETLRGSRRSGRLSALAKRFPDHPEILRHKAERALARGEGGTARRRLLAYANARPVDPWPHEKLAELALRADEPERAIPSLRALDRRARKSGAYARRLARIHRRAGRLAQAADAIERALRRDPYNATDRETAAAIAVQRGRLERARRHVEALCRIEPKRGRHRLRLAVIERRLGRHEAARAAARRAKELDPSLDVSRFLDESG